MSLDFFFKGNEEIEKFKEMRIEIKLPVNNNEAGYKYCDNIEYYILKNLHYTIKHIPTDTFDYEGTFSGIDIKNNQVFIENDIIYFYPYKIDQDTLDLFIEDNIDYMGLSIQNNFDDMELYFKLELNKIQEVIEDTVNSNGGNELCTLIHNCLNYDIIISYVFDTDDIDDNDDNPTKKHKKE